MKLAIAVPQGYARVDERGAVIVARQDLVNGVVAAYRAAPPDAPTLHGFASRADGARRFQGRETAYAVTLPGTATSVVVRHNRHGGALRALTGDIFLGGTRAPMELDIAVSLAALGVPTPTIAAYAVYPAGAGFSRSDVLTEEITGSIDLGGLLLSSAPDSDARKRGWDATRRLLRKLADAGARHHDLNVKNILLQETPTGSSAYVLDVDRVELGQPSEQADAGNLARLTRSLVKWRETKGAAITDAEISELRRTEPSTR